MSCHGDTYEDSEGKFWGLVTIDKAYGADRVVKAIIAEGYDAIVLTACNPDGLPLAVESETGPRPTIIRFNVDNSFDIPENEEEPIKIIPALSRE